VVGIVPFEGVSQIFFERKDSAFVFQNRSR